jgi:hypothetical protein
MARIREKRNAYRSLVGKPEGKRALGRPKRWCMDNTSIRIDVGVVWTELVSLRTGTSEEFL